MGSETSLISIALCTYNGERFLPMQLDSLLAQDYPRIEIVAVDDGSTDNTLEVLYRYQAHDSRLRVYRNSINLGFAKNFEQAIQLCSGKLIAPCDQDDIWHPDKLSRLAAIRGDAALVYCDSLLVDEQNNSLGLKASDKLNMYQGNDPRPFLFYNCVSGHALICTKELTAKAMPFPAGTYHDWWLASVAAATGEIKYLDECLVRFRQHTSSQTDLSGTKLDELHKREGYGARMVEQRTFLIKAIRDISNEHHHNFLNEFYNAWADWRISFFSPSLAFFIREHRRVLFYISKNPRLHKFNRTLDYFFGLKMKRLFKPYKYRTTSPRF